jgi:hypothetical protein
LHFLSDNFSNAILRALQAHEILVLNPNLVILIAVGFIKKVKSAGFVIIFNAFYIKITS